ncbi:MAG: TRIC cation channel family protein, partial [Clostridia bacterium]|nr:TRIC cation channel family protein [Clostridia bacterium]
VTPPKLLFSFEFRVLAVLCLAVSAFVFSISFFGNVADALISHSHNFWLELTDSVGLAAFCVLGVDSTLSSRPDLAGNALLLVFSGCITGVGGGVLRDMLSAEVPLLFRKHIYFIPAVLGSLIYVFLLPLQRQVLSYLISMGIILLIRLLAMHFKWNLPSPLDVSRK